MLAARRLLAPVSLALALCGVGSALGAGLMGPVHAQRRGAHSSMRSSRPSASRASMSASRASMSASRASHARHASSMSSSGRRGGRRSSSARVTAAYRRQVVRWHQRPDSEAVSRWEQQSPPALVFRPVRYPGEYSLLPDATGGFTDYQLRAARKAFTYRDALTHDVHPALMERAYRIAREFRLPYLWLVSGYRDTRSTSRHSQGRAMDVVAPGVSNAQLARFARTFGYTGVGEYPQSGFVHIDVRARSYFWVDSSAPGARSRERQVRRSEADRADRAARGRGHLPVSDAPEQTDDESSDQDDPVPAAGGSGEPAVRVPS